MTNDCGPHKTLYNRWKRWGEMGFFVRIMEGLEVESVDPRTVTLDAADLKAHRTASGRRVKKGISALIGSTRGGMTTKPHAATTVEAAP